MKALRITAILLTAASLSFASDPAAMIAEHVPAQDPEPSQKIEILPSMRGVHPRLIKTTEEFAAYREAAISDTIVAEQVAGILASVPANGQVNPAFLTRIFSGPTPALVTAFDGPLPMMVMAHGLNPTPESKAALIQILTALVETEYWETRHELESGMQMGAIATLAGITFDMIRDELDPEFRAKAARKLFQQARNQYYLGHLQRLPVRAHYWQQDPQNNHRWHRNSGLVSCLLAVAGEPGIDAGWMLEQVKKEMDFILEWFPEEGDNHESVTYSIFGFAHLALAATMMDRVLGTNYTQHPGIAHAWELLVYAYSPERGGYLTYGDSRNQPNQGFGKVAAFFLGPKVSRDRDAQAAMIQLYHWLQSNRDGTQVTWLMVPFYDPTLEPGDINNLPLSKFFADLGLAYFRDSWEQDATILMYICGPFGGFKLNEYRETNNRHYINVAHSDPDANTFSFIIDGKIVPHASGYDSPKRTANHNTWLVNGKGQLGEGGLWMQPVNMDMRTMAYPTAWVLMDDGRAAVEGEASGAYPDLTRYRRSMVWLPGDYVLMLDDLAADGEATMAWNALAEKGEFTDPDSGRATLIEEQVRLPLQIKADQPLKAFLERHQTRGKDNYDLQSMRYKFSGESVRTATLLNPWSQQDLDLNFEPTDGGAIRLTITHPKGTDTWTWTPAPDIRTPATLVGQRDGETLLTLGPGNQVDLGW